MGPAVDTIGTAGDAMFWDRIARKYAASRIADPAGYERTLERTRALLGAEDRVLELGCGTGTTALRLADRVRNYLATDFSAGMIAIAEAKLAAADAPRPAFRCASAEDLAREGHAFDAVLGFNYLHLVADLPGTLGAIRDLLEPGGLLVTKTPSVGDMSPVIRLALPLMRLVGKAPHVNVFTSAGLARAIAAAGFEIVAQEWHGTTRKDPRPFIVARRR